MSNNHSGGGEGCKLQRMGDCLLSGRQLKGLLSNRDEEHDRDNEDNNDYDNLGSTNCLRF